MMEDTEDCEPVRFIGVSSHVPQRRRRRGDAEKKRRKRINKCLDDLEKIVPEVRRRRLVAKVDKAEILEMTVEFVRQATSRDLFSRTGTPSAIVPPMELNQKTLLTSRTTRHDHAPNINTHSPNTCTSGSCTACDNTSSIMMTHPHITSRHHIMHPRLIPNCMRCHWPEYPTIRPMPNRRTFQEFNKIQ